MHHAIERFASKGYHQTTMQDIADAAGIAKGGIYFYFKSKEELIHSVFADYVERVYLRISETAGRYEIGSREGLVQQFYAQLEEMSSRDSIIMLLTTGQVDISREMRELAKASRLRSLVWFRGQFIQVYGTGIEPHAFDLAALTAGLVKEYTAFGYMFDKKFSLHELAGDDCRPAGRCGPRTGAVWPAACTNDRRGQDCVPAGTIWR